LLALEHGATFDNHGPSERHGSTGLNVSFGMHTRSETHSGKASIISNAKFAGLYSRCEDRQTSRTRTNSFRSDVLIFGADERGPDGDLRLQFEAVSRFALDEKKVIKALLEGMILKHEAKRWSSAA